MTLSFNEDVMRVSQIYVPIRVLSLEIREGHYAEVALSVCERERGMLCQPNVGREGALRKQAC